MQKLIRDYIPQILDEKGKSYQIRQLTDEEYLKALEAKLVEEVSEFNELAAKKKEELADILEVIDALYIAYDFTKEEIASIKEQKKRQRGAFEQKLLLVALEK